MNRISNNKLQSVIKFCFFSKISKYIFSTLSGMIERKNNNFHFEPVQHLKMFNTKSSSVPSIPSVLNVSSVQPV